MGYASECVSVGFFRVDKCVIVCILQRLSGNDVKGERALLREKEGSVGFGSIRDPTRIGTFCRSGCNELVAERAKEVVWSI